MAWDRNTPYRRYAITESGVSPLAFPSAREAVVKVNSYAHDEAGITTDEAGMVTRMQEKTSKRGRASRGISKGCRPSPFPGRKGPGTPPHLGFHRRGLPRGGDALGLRVVQPVVLSPFPGQKVREALEGSRRVVTVEQNATGQLGKLLALQSIRPDGRILKYDGRPFALDELEARVREALA